jgi:hypothetical protein
VCSPEKISHLFGFHPDNETHKKEEEVSDKIRWKERGKSTREIGIELHVSKRGVIVAALTLLTYYSYKRFMSGQRR